MIFAALQAHLGRLKKVHWHHHVLRGAIAAHVVHAMFILRGFTFASFDGVVDAVCIVFVVSDYVLSDMEVAHREKIEREVESRQTVQPA